MGIAISEEGKLKEMRGTGHGASYKPWIKIREINSSGTASSFPDWKHGRMIELLSQAELWFYHVLRWNDDVEDIREQFPLDLDETTEIARNIGFRPAMNGMKRMTTDLLVTMKDGTEAAFSVKASRDDIRNNRRAMELQMIEMEYWKRKGIRWGMLFKEDLDVQMIRNIMDAVTCYEASRVHDEFSLIRHLIANKLIIVDMGKPIEYVRILKELKEGGEWTRYAYMLE